MPMYDYQCKTCGLQQIDVLEPIVSPIRLCDCGGTLTRTWLTKFPAVHSDSIRGGILIHNGICDADGKPVRYYSKSDMRRAAKEKGVQPRVEHIGDVERGTDKARKVNGKEITSRWI